MQELCIMFVHIQKKEEPAALPMYHVLEGPTPVETTPDTQESEVGHFTHTMSLATGVKYSTLCTLMSYFL